MSIRPHRPQQAATPCRTLIELLRARAEEHPARVLFSFLADGEEAEQQLTYGELDRRARSIGARLQAAGARGERVLLLYPPGLEYIAAFFGCLYAGAVAVPSYPPRANRSFERLQAINADARAKFALTNGAVHARVRALLPQSPRLAELFWHVTDELEAESDADHAAHWQAGGEDAETLAFLQYTSGSTGQPKGVMVTHGNLLHNQRVIREAFRQDENSIVVGWLPLYHDMGLIGNVVQPLYVGGRCVLFSPVSFLQRPSRWLRAITRHRATTSGAPNFAYDLCVRKIGAEERAALDLSSWRVAFNGSEPVRNETLERFATAFEPCGFRREVFYPCYGLAEATLLVSAKSGTASPKVLSLRADALERNHVVEATEGVDGSSTHVSCGTPAAGHRVVIAHPETLKQCAPQEVGEILLTGASVAAGYWQNPFESQNVFRAFLAETGEGPFLRTGDLGFVRDGELFITGRLKDLIIIRGLNHYPQDIEATVALAHTSLRPNSAAAFSIDDHGEERLVILQEIDSGAHQVSEAVIDSIREAVAANHEINPQVIVLARPGSVLKTSSGKVQRGACKTAFLEGKLNIVAMWQASADEPGARSPQEEGAQQTGELETWLADLAAATLAIDSRAVDLNLPLARYGLDSLAAVEITHHIETRHGINVPLTGLLQDLSIARLATFILEEQAKTSGAVVPLAVRAVEDASEFPLSYGQRALWFLQRLAPESPAYNLSGAVRIHGTVDAPALQRAFAALVERHASLRASFADADPEPVQRIREHGASFFQEVDATDWNSAKLDDTLVAEVHRPFSLETDAPLRVWLFRRGEGADVLLLCVHHIVADLWSLGILVRELGAFYRRETKGGALDLQPHKSSYTDYVSWQAKRLAGAEGERLWKFWERELSGAEHVLNLPFDRPRPRTQSFRGASRRFRLDAETTRRLRSLGESQGVTLFTILLTGFQLLLQRYTGQDDLCVGTPVAARSRADFADLIGYFVNTLVLRADCAADPSFEEFLRRTREKVLAALEHQDFPFPLLVERMQPERSGELSPLVQAMFVLQKSQAANSDGLAALALGEAGTKIEMGELSFESIALEQRNAIFDLTLMMADAGDGLESSWQYNTDVFDEATVTRMAAHFQVLLESALAAPGQRLSLLPLLTHAERHELLIEWNDTSAGYPQDGCIQQLFEAQAVRTPDAVALVCGSERVTFLELKSRAAQVANFLRQHGVAPESRVGICTERSTEMLVAVLGVLMAGGAYVPLDPTYPSERLAYMLDDAGITLLLTQERLLKLTHGRGAQVVCLDRDWHLFAQQETQVSHDGDADTNNLAYVIYTSGSTGKSKGVLATQRNLLHTTRARFKYYGAPVGKFLLLSSFAFDSSIAGIFWTLCDGGSLVLPPPGFERDPARLVELIERNQITHLLCLPSLYDLLLDESPSRQLDSLRVVIVAGETCPSELLERHRQTLPQAALFNEYGPTEVSVWSLVYKAEQDRRRAKVPVGHPIENTQAYLLDRRGQIVPVGVTGELYLAGIGVTRGYLNRPAQTAERFLPDSFSDEPGGRLYRTGDLARYLPDGMIDFLGRTDRQVKIRGFRIELNEIETELREHEAVGEALVVAHENATGDRRLIAYVVPADVKRGLAVDELRSHLKNLLPAYMLPADFIELNELPLTPNGKINRQALPSPGRSRPERANDFVEARTPVEEKLVEIWSEVLGIDVIGVEDNFFDLGGHSLLAMRITSRVEKAFGVKLALRSMFDEPTIAHIAELVFEAQLAEMEEGELAAIFSELGITDNLGQS